MRESYLNSLKSAVIWKGMDRIAALLKHIVIAGAIGFSAQLDVFYLAVGLLGVIVFSWGNLIDVLAVPRLVALDKNEKWRSLDQLTGGFFVLTLLIGCALGVFFLLFRGGLSKIPAGLDPFRQGLLYDAFYWVLPVVILYIPLRFMGAIYRSRRQFSLFYQGEAIIAIISFSLVFLFRDEPHVLLWSFSCGVLFAFGYLCCRSKNKIRLFAAPWSSEVKIM